MLPAYVVFTSAIANWKVVLSIASWIYLVPSSNNTFAFNSSNLLRPYIILFITHLSTIVTFFPCMGKSWNVLLYIECTFVDGVPQYGQTASFLDDLTQITILSSFISYRTHSRFLSSSFTISSMMTISFLIELVHYTIWKYLCQLSMERTTFSFSTSLFLVHFYFSICTSGENSLSQTMYL